MATEEVKLNCQIDLGGRGADKPLTVGDTFALSCDGTLPAPLEKTAQFVWSDETQAYTLHVLDVVESDASHVKMSVTSYRPAQVKDYVLTLSDGRTTVKTSPLEWTVNSVLSPQDEKPVPSMGPFSLSYPMWMWAGLAGAVVFAAILIFYFIYRRRKRQKLLESLDRYMTMLPPFAQFSKDLRVFTRELGHVKDETKYGELAKKLDEDFRLYLVRELRVPALEYSDRGILGEIKNEHRAVFEECRAELLRTLSEFSKAKKDLGALRAKDCEDLLQMSRRTAEKINALRRAKKTGASGAAGRV